MMTVDALSFRRASVHKTSPAKQAISPKGTFVVVCTEMNLQIEGIEISLQVRLHSAIVQRSLPHCLFLDCIVRWGCCRIVATNCLASQTHAPMEDNRWHWPGWPKPDWLAKQINLQLQVEERVATCVSIKCERTPKVEKSFLTCKII